MTDKSDISTEKPSESGPSEGGWLNSWLSAAKNKSTEVLEFVKKDLEEFGNAVKNEASNVVTSAGSVMEKTLSFEAPDSTVNTVKRSFSTFLGQMNTVLNPSPEDEDTEILIVENSETHELTKLQKALYQLQKNADTFLSDPQPYLQEQYQCWLEILEPNQLSDERIVKYVNSSELLKKQYAQLVPDIVDHQLFWKRYLFKKALLEDELARQEIIEKKESKEKEKILKQEVDSQWEPDLVSHLDLTEEQQIALLEEYEKEQNNKKSKNENLENVKDKEKTVGKSTTPSSSNCSTDDDWEKISDVEK
ncbi:hypothetical protein ABEB36_006834 [Hypothenemus hampei]|uniref:BSD domain-containing protein n=1 Tax=Hypothenemus hampei TaxID=57062 RepID=A0ABD1ERX0_HYPHA